MKRLIVFIGTIGLVVVGLGSTSASADPPVVVESSITFEDINPCSGEVHELTLNFVDRIHEHEGNLLFTSARSGETDSGFSIVNGTESFVDNGQVVRGSFVDNWANPDTGERLQARGVFVFNINQLSLKVDRFTLRCV